MLWVKAFHIVFIASWFAGLFYLPRIFVNLAMVAPGSVAERERITAEVLRVFNGRNAAEVARRLGIGRATVYRIIKQEGSKK